MSHHLSSVPHIDSTVEECITNCSECHAICTATVRYCLRTGGEHAAPALIGALLDCAQTCELSHDLMLRASPLRQLYCRGCAHACGSCASACERFANDDVMRACAEACRRCMESCRAMGGACRH